MDASTTRAPKLDLARCLAVVLEAQVLGCPRRCPTDGPPGFAEVVLRKLVRQKEPLGTAEMARKLVDVAVKRLYWEVGCLSPCVGWAVA